MASDSFVLPSHPILLITIGAEAKLWVCCLCKIWSFFCLLSCLRIIFSHIIYLLVFSGPKTSVSLFYL